MAESPLFFLYSSFAPFNSSETLSNVSWTGFIQMNFDTVGSSPYSTKKGAMNHDIAACPIF
jgi:hypothetical protein